jgi:O-antigen ligase
MPLLIRNYAPSLLIVLGLLLQGAKTPAAFCLWGLAALSFSITAIKTRGIWAAAILAVLLIAQFFSLDASHSLFFMTQALVFFLLWPALADSLSEETARRYAWITLAVCGWITVGLTLYQRVNLTVPHGLLPINPNFNAAWMASLAVAFLAKILTTRNLSVRERRSSIALVVVLSVAVLMGSSRSALLALIAGALYTVSIKSLRKTWLLGVTIGLLGVVLFSPQTLLDRFRLDLDQPISSYRLQIWKVALQGALDRPLTGYGWGNFEIAYQRHAFPVESDPVRFGRTTEFAHNEILQVAADAGLPAAFLVLVGLLFLLTRSTKQKSEERLPAKAAFIALAVTALFNPVWQHPFLLFMTLFWSASLLSMPPQPAPASRYQRAGQALLIVCTGMLLGWMGLRAHWASDGKWEQITRWNPQDGRAWKHLAFAQSGPAHALPFLEQAVRQSPADVYLREALAAVLEQSTRPEDGIRAQKEYETALHWAPQRAINRLAIGRLFYRQGNAEAALPWFRQALTTEPHYWESELWIARTLAALGQKEQGIRLLKQLAARRDHFLKMYPAYRPRSIYENRILAYDDSVVEAELKRLQSRKQNVIIPNHSPTPQAP